MATEPDECQVTVTGVAPAVVAITRKAVRIAAEHGRNWVGTEDLLAALVVDGSDSPPWWQDEGGMTFEQLQQLVTAAIPGPTPPGVGPALPATVSYELSGPHADEFRAMLEKS